MNKILSPASQNSLEHIKGSGRVCIVRALWVGKGAYKSPCPIKQALTATGQSRCSLPTPVQWFSALHWVFCFFLKLPKETSFQK